jgi:hypothetical protein
MFGVVDQEHDPEVTDPETPEIRSGEFGHAGRAGLDAERHDRPAPSSGLSWRKSAELALSRGSELDPPAALAHVSSES